MAREALRSALTETIDRAVYGPRGKEEGTSAEQVAGELVDLFPEVHWQYRVNENGVRVRALVATGKEEIDPAADGPVKAETHEFVHVTYKGRFQLECGHVTPLGRGEGRMCNALEGDPVHTKTAHGRPDRAYNCVGHTVGCGCMADWQT
jgi:hypothetical protein